MVDIPADVERTLRKEVGYVCPMPGCVSPYLTFHHFDPPRRVREHNDPAGMIALCAEHHLEADADTYPVERLRALKAGLKDREVVSGKFNWSRETTLFVAGGLYFLNCPIVLKMGGHDIVWLSKNDDDTDQINFDLFSSSGEIVFSMRDNVWRVLPSIEDIKAPPQRRSLSIRSKKQGISLDMRFQPNTAGNLRTTIYERTLRRLAPSPGTPKSPLDISEESASLVANGIFDRVGADVDAEVLICEVSCDLLWPVAVDVSPTRVHIIDTDIELAYSVFYDRDVGLEIDSKGHIINLF